MGSSPRCGKLFFSQSTSSADSLTVSVQPPCTIACIDICMHFSHTIVWTRENIAHKGQWAALLLQLLCLTQRVWRPEFPQGIMKCSTYLLRKKKHLFPRSAIRADFRGIAPTPLYQTSPPQPHPQVHPTHSHIHRSIPPTATPTGPFHNTARHQQPTEGGVRSLDGHAPSRGGPGLPHCCRSTSVVFADACSGPACTGRTYS